MSSDRLPELFYEALELDERGRGALLDRLRREEPDLANELARLLAAPEAAPSPIDGGPELPAGLDPAGDEILPERVGPYRLLRQVGRGGMGRVFLAEQVTPDFRRTVALKVIDHPGPDAEAVRRFRDEVRILASLEHPGIARFLDGGQSPEGVWFLALEYVEGDNLLSHARQRALTVDQRVRLCLAVVEAVAYAHQRGVMHRDIKPGNVMVGRDGRPRLLDFGISKLFDPSHPEGLTTTQHPMVPLTPAYASPEQLAGGIVTSASDVYSLGVVLYELLTDRRPGTDPGSTSAGSGIEPPSVVARRVASTSGRSPRSAAGSSGGARQRISRDLDAICLKALRRDPAERYANGNELHADLCRYLDGERVEARGGARRLRGGALRSPALRLAVAAALLVAFASIGVWRMARRPAADAPPAATAEPRPFPFDPVNPPPVEESERRFSEAPDDVVAGAALALGLAREKRLEEARLVVGRLRQIPQRELDPLADYVEGRLAVLQSESQRALVFYTRALDRATELGRAELVPTLRYAKGSLLSTLGQRDSGQAELVTAHDEAKRAGDSKLLYRTLNEVAVNHFQSGEMAAGEAALEEALAAGREGGLVPITALSNLAEVRLLRARPDLAEPLAREALERRRSFPNASREADERARLFLILRDLGRSADAEPEIRAALALLDAPADLAHRSAVTYALAQARLEDGRIEGLVDLVAQLEGGAQETLRRRPLGFAHLVRAQLAELRGEPAEARRRFQEARRLFLLEGDRDLVAHASVLHAEAEARVLESGAALAALDEGLAAFAPDTATLPAYVGETVRARLLAADGDPAAARARLAELGPDVARTPSVRLKLAFLMARAEVAAAQGRVTEAKADLEQALQVAAASGRKVVELELRLALARLSEAPDARAARERIRREAEALGLLSLSAQARLGGGSPVASGSGSSASRTRALARAA